MNPGAAVWSRPPSARRDDAGRVLAATVAILGLALALRVAMAPQFDGLDDVGYLDAAQRVSRGESLDGLFPLFRTRVGMAYPMGWLLRAGWLAPAGFWILTTLAEALTLVALVAAGWLLTGAARAGLAAAAVYAVYPLAVQQSAMFHPTAFQVAAVAIALALVAGAGRVVDPRIARALALAAGVSLGLGYLVKEDVAIVVPAMAVASLLTGFPRRSVVALCCAGAAAVFVAESGVYWMSTGDPLFRLSASSGLGAAPRDQLRISEIWGWDAFPRSLFLLPAQVGLVWWLALPALWSAWRRREARLAWTATVFLGLAAYLQFGSGALTSYVPLPRTPRYTAIVAPLLMVIVGAWLAELYQRRRLRLVAALAVAIACAAVPSLLYLEAASSERSRNTLAVLPVLRDEAPAHLYTDYYGARLIRVLAPDLSEVSVWYHARFDTNQILVTGDPASEAGALVLLDRQAAKVYTSSYELTLPARIAEPPREWELVWTHRAYGDGTVVRGLLEGVRAAAAWLPADVAWRDRIRRNIADMIDGDEARLYRVPATRRGAASP